MLKIINTVLFVLFFLVFSYGQRFKAVQLFNGKNLIGWHEDVLPRTNDSLPLSPFLVRNGLLVSLGEPQGHIITNKKYKNYRIEVEYRFAGKPGNCGLILHASTPRALYGQFPKSIEAQMMHSNAGDFWCIVEDIEALDMEKRRGPKENWGTTEGKERRIANLTDNSEKPLRSWNKMVVECFKDKIKVWVNGDLVNYGFNCTANQGQIALQSEGAEVEFRKVALSKIKMLH